MVYPGGKDRIAKEIVPLLLNMRDSHTTYIEPFVGGANIMWRIASQFDKAIGADYHQDLILLYQAVQNGWIPPDPSTVTQEQHDQLRNAEPSALRGYIGICCSFHGIWFGGFADFLNQRQANYNALLRQMREMTNVRFVHADYRSLTKVGPHCLIYCDPPYYASSGYATGARHFDSGEFWAHARTWRAQGATVVVSEYQAPTDAQEIWSRSKRVTLSASGFASTHMATERLFVLQGE